MNFFLKSYIGACRFIRVKPTDPKERIEAAIENLRNPQIFFTSFWENILKALTDLLRSKLVFLCLMTVIAYVYFQGRQGEFFNLKDIMFASSIFGLMFIVLLILRFCTNKRRVKEDIEFPQNHIKSISWGLFNVDTKEIPENRFKVADATDAESIARLNIEAYSGGVWETNLNNKLVRNRDHIKKNKNSILLIKSNTKDDYIGFTHVLPVNKRVWNCYTAGKFTDNKFYDKYIMGDEFDPKYERPYGLIYFSAVIPYNDAKDKHANEDEVNRYKGALLEQCTAYHFSIFLNNMFKERNRVKVLFNNFDDSFYRPFEKEAINNREMTSGEKAPIYVFEITNK